MFRHMAILKFKFDAKSEDIDAYFAAFPGLVASLPVIKNWYIGKNEGAGGESHVKRHNFRPNYDVGLVLEFDSPDGYLAYAESNVHQTFFEKYCTPIFSERVVCQFIPK